MENKKIAKTFRLSPEAIAVLDEQDNATKFIEYLILGGTEDIKEPTVAGITEARVIELIKEYTPKHVAPASTTFVPTAPDPETGYPCCTKKTPCKHWVFDGTKDAYVNSLTGKVKSLLDEIDIADL
jgi:hypothetical protein